MIYIDKRQTTSTAIKEKLEAWEATFADKDKKSIATLLQEHGGNAYEQIRGQWDEMYQELRNTLHREQSGLCCYCGEELVYKGSDSHQTVLEHFKPKSKYPDLTFKYDNILLSCGGGGDKK